jgi:hypothetical protein
MTSNTPNPPDPLDLELAKFRAQGDQLRSFLRDAILKMDNAAVTEVFRDCARGNLSDFDERTALFVGTLAVVGFIGLFEPPDGEEE